MTARREYLTTWLLLALLGAGLLFAYRMPWYQARESLSTGGYVDVAGSGLDASPVGASMGVVVLAAALAILVTGGLARRIVAALAVVAGVAGAVLAAVWAISEPTPTWIGDTGHVVDWAVTIWWAVAAGCGILAAAAGVWAVLRCDRWATMSTRYDRGARQPRDAWEALDRGVDPTLDT